MREAFIEAVKSHQQAFQLELPDQTIQLLGNYYDLVQEHNPILHLVGPSSPEEFATRHILESLTLLEFLPRGARFADVGAGAGLPSIPCLIARDDLKAVLIESKEKKAEFLRHAVQELGLNARAEIVNRQFSETSPDMSEHIVCRALDKFVDKFPQILKWSRRRRLLLFGGPSLEEAIKRQKQKYQRRLLPLSERRYLFVVAAGIARN